MLPVSLRGGSRKGGGRSREWRRRGGGWRRSLFPQPRSRWTPGSGKIGWSVGWQVGLNRWGGEVGGGNLEKSLWWEGREFLEHGWCGVFFMPLHIVFGRGSSLGAVTS